MRLLYAELGRSLPELTAGEIRDLSEVFCETAQQMVVLFTRSVLGILSFQHWLYCAQGIERAR